MSVGKRGSLGRVSCVVQAAGTFAGMPIKVTQGREEPRQELEPDGLVAGVMSNLDRSKPSGRGSDRYLD
jgi:hypothetical protein